MDRIKFRTGRIFYNHIEIVYVTFPNLLKMGIWMDVIQSLFVA